MNIIIIFRSHYLSQRSLLR